MRVDQLLARTTRISPPLSFSLVRATFACLFCLGKGTPWDSRTTARLNRCVYGDRCGGVEGCNAAASLLALIIRWWGGVFGALQLVLCRRPGIRYPFCRLAHSARMVSCSSTAQSWRSLLPHLISSSEPTTRAAVVAVIEGSAHNRKVQGACGLRVMNLSQRTPTAHDMRVSLCVFPCNIKSQVASVYSSNYEGGTKCSQRLTCKQGGINQRRVWR